MIIFRLSTLYPILAHLSAHRFLHGRADPCLVGGGQLRPSEGGRPRAPSSRFAVSLKPNVVYLLLTSAHFGRSRRPCRPRHTRASRTRVSARGWRAGFDDGMEPLNHGAIRFRQLGDLREPPFRIPFPLPSMVADRVCSRAARPARLASSVSTTSTSTRRTPPPRHRTGGDDVCRRRPGPQRQVRYRTPP